MHFPLRIRPALPRQRGARLEGNRHLPWNYCQLFSTQQEEAQAIRLACPLTDAGCHSIFGGSSRTKRQRNSMVRTANVDIVITWVDGNDPQWRQQKSRYRPDVRRSLLTADVEGRYRCNEELRFLLRSIERYWPMQGRIHLVT